MEAFLSTLASVSVTILTLLAASYAAYAVFFNQQAAKFDDLIAEDKVNIRDRLFALRIHWGGALPYFLAPEFKEKYRAYVGGLAGTAFVNKAAVDTIFSGAEIQRALSDTRPDAMLGPEKGRFYLWALNELVTYLARGMDQATEMKGVFPSDAGGTGFDEWRADFEDVRTSVSMLETMQQPMLQDFLQFLAQPERAPNAGAGPYAQTAVSNVFADITAIQQTLTDIDKQTLLRRPYSFMKRTHGLWILILVVLAFIAGVLVPTALLTTDVKQNTIAGVSLLSGTLAFLIGAVVLFGWDVLHQPDTPKSDFVKSRWRPVLLNALKDTNTKIANGSLLDREQLLNANSARENPLLPVNVKGALAQYDRDSLAYNEASLTFSQKIAESIRSDAVISKRLVPSGMYGSFTLYPIQVFDSQALDNLEKNLKTNPQQAVSFEIQGPTWSRRVVLIAPSTIPADNVTLVTRFREIGRKLQGDPLKQRFDTTKQKVSSSAKVLESALQSWQ